MSTSRKYLKSVPNAMNLDSSAMAPVQLLILKRAPIN